MLAVLPTTVPPPATPTAPMSWLLHTDGTVVEVVLEVVVVVGTGVVVDELLVEELVVDLEELVVEDVVTVDEVEVDVVVELVVRVVDELLVVVVVVGTVVDVLDVVVELVVDVLDVVEVVVVVGSGTVVVVGATPPLRVTPSSVAVVRSVLSCEVTGSPTYTLAAMVIVSLPISVHVVPFAEA